MKYFDGCQDGKYFAKSVTEDFSSRNGSVKKVLDSFPSFTSDRRYISRNSTIKKAINDKK